MDSILTKKIEDATPRHLDLNRLLRLRQVLEIIPVSRACFLAWVSAGIAPKPIKIGRCTFWAYRSLLEMIRKEGA